MPGLEGRHNQTPGEKSFAAVFIERQAAENIQIVLVASKITVCRHMRSNKSTLFDAAPREIEKFRGYNNGIVHTG
jgi:hypothetical protein